MSSNGSPSFNESILSALRARLTGVFPAQIRSSLELLTEEQIWMRPNEESNSVGNIVLHLTGSLSHFVSRGLGGFEYERDRPAEFSAHALPKAELISRFDAMVAQVDSTFDKLTPERLAEPSTEPKLFATVFEDLLNAAMHLSNHSGQIVWITKSLRDGGTGSELWMVAHRNHGGWKRDPA